MVARTVSRRQQRNPFPSRSRASTPSSGGRGSKLWSSKTSRPSKDFNVRPRKRYNSWPRSMTQPFTHYHGMALIPACSPNSFRTYQYYVVPAIFPAPLPVHRSFRDASKKRPHAKARFHRRASARPVQVPSTPVLPYTQRVCSSIMSLPDPALDRSSRQMVEAGIDYFGSNAALFERPVVHAQQYAQDGAAGPAPVPEASAAQEAPGTPVLHGALPCRFDAEPPCSPAVQSLDASTSSGAARPDDQGGDLRSGMAGAQQASLQRVQDSAAQRLVEAENRRLRDRIVELELRLTEKQ